MKRPNITPGPWATPGPHSKSCGIPFRVTCEIGNGVADCNASTGKSDAEKAANARAIAAVPDTHKALERALGTLERMADKLESYDVGTVEAIRAALTKAGYTF